MMGDELDEGRGFKHLPRSILIFRDHILDSDVYLSIYYILYVLISIGLVVLLGYQFDTLYLGTKELQTFYNSWYIIQALSLVFLFPLQLAFQKGILHNKEFAQLLDDAVSIHPQFVKNMKLISGFNMCGFFISLGAFGYAVQGSSVRFYGPLFFFLIILFPLPISITIIVILMDCHAYVTNDFICRLSQAGQALSCFSPAPQKHFHPSHPILPTINAPMDSDQLSLPLLTDPPSSALQPPVLSEPYLPSPTAPIDDLPLSVQEIIQEYLLLRDQYIKTSELYGFLISLLSINSLLLMLYLIATVYLYNASIASLVGFISIDVCILIEVFVWTSRANEYGYTVIETINDFYLRALTSRRKYSSDDMQDLQRLCQVCSRATLEVRGIGKVAIRFKLAITITVGLAASFIPKLLLPQ
jgi:hypothetical protein